MGLLEDLNNESNFPKQVRAWCSVCTELEKMNAKEREALLTRFADKNISHIALSKVLRANGIDLSDSVIGRHRRGICKGVARK